MTFSRKTKTRVEKSLALPFVSYKFVTIRSGLEENSHWNIGTIIKGLVVFYSVYGERKRLPHFSYRNPKLTDIRRNHYEYEHTSSPIPFSSTPIISITYLNSIERNNANKQQWRYICSMRTNRLNRSASSNSHIVSQVRMSPNRLQATQKCNVQRTTCENVHSLGHWNPKFRRNN